MGDTESFYRGTQPKECGTQAATETWRTLTVNTHCEDLVYKLSRCIAIYIAYESEKKAGQS